MNRSVLLQRPAFLSTVCLIQCPTPRSIQFRLRELLVEMPRLYCLLFQWMLGKDPASPVHMVLA